MNSKQTINNNKRIKMNLCDGSDIDVDGGGGGDGGVNTIN